MVANLDEPKIPQHIKDSAKLFTNTWSMDVKRRVKGSRGKNKSGEQQKWCLEELLTAPKHPITKWWFEMCDLAKTRGTYRFLVANKATYHSYIVLGEREITYLRGCVQTATNRMYEPREWPAIFGPSITLAGISPEIPEELTVFEFKSFVTRVDSRMLGGLGALGGIGDDSEAGTAAY